VTHIGCDETESGSQELKRDYLDIENMKYEDQSKNSLEVKKMYRGSRIVTEWIWRNVRGVIM